MTGLDQDRVWARHRPLTGAVLVVGAGAVGGFLAEELARIGFSPLVLVDPERLAVENLLRHPLGAPALDRPKAPALAAKIRTDFPPCAATGLQADFTALPADERRALVASADVVVAATDSADCQHAVNLVALQTGTPAVFPGVWVDPRIRDAEVGEILWVDPQRPTPCYACAAAFRRGAADAQAARGARVDIQLVALATAQVVTALAHAEDDHAAILDPERTAIYLHGFTPTSAGVRATFPLPGLSSRPVRVPFPTRPCPACRRSRFPSLGPVGDLPATAPGKLAVGIALAALTVAVVVLLVSAAFGHG
ncbi:HesA/MoeB/ThiF family protein [Streptacidiphilus jiangxiensis]|uniref:ThiF family protein n=1 Tax=Streptacidiphilus jiangxiensis TaxID=235985 RepID=A0A1H7QTQ0_STRJI|nr:ThiF family adenylyltransferase [Streptacidiphilus jiangxiensis]SEL51302.1 ThiF family protein [Streptacidiphilus jiangxiensis]